MKRNPSRGMTDSFPAVVVGAALEPDAKALLGAEV
jgi:hypothetical protein